MRASAHLAVARRQDARSRITHLHSEPPLVLRPTTPVGGDPLPHWFRHSISPVRVSLVAGAAGPVGGDELRLCVDVGTGAALDLRNVAATLALPGPHRQPSRMEVTIRVAAGGTLVWLPRQVIAAKGCDHHAMTHVTLESGARMLMREELLLGRHAESPGTIRQHLRVCLGGRPLHDQEFCAGPGAGGWDSSAILGGRRALGSVLIVDPGWDGSLAERSRGAADTESAILPLGGSAVLITALATDGLALHHKLDAELAAVETALLGASP